MCIIKAFNTLKSSIKSYKDSTGVSDGIINANF